MSTEGTDHNQVKEAINIIKAYKITGDSETAKAVIILAAASKQDIAVRRLLANEDVLQKLIQIVDDISGDSYDTLDPALRCIGNACADNDRAREVVTKKGFSWAKKSLCSLNDDIRLIAVKVLYNICIDSDLAQQRCFQEGIHLGLAGFCDSDSAVSNPDTTMAIDLLFWIIGHKTQLEPVRSSPLPGTSLSTILSLPNRYTISAEMDDFAELVETALAYLRDETVQTQIVNERLLNAVYQILLDIESKLVETNPEHTDSAAAMKILAPLSASVTWCLSDIAAKPEFVQLYSLQDETIESILRYIQTNELEDVMSSERAESQSRLLAAAAQIVGNLLWALPVNSYAYLVQQEHLQTAAFRTITAPHNGKATTGLLHSMAGLLTQLSRSSPEVRNDMGSDELCLPALERLCRHDMKEIKDDGIRLLRALGVGCMANQERFGDLAEEVFVPANGRNLPPPEGTLVTNGVA